jgi:hypothetical protein
MPRKNQPSGERPPFPILILKDRNGMLEGIAKDGLLKPIKKAEKPVKIFKLGSKEAERSGSDYWASKSPADRVVAVDILRKIYSGTKDGRKVRLRRSVRIIKLGES